MIRAEQQVVSYTYDSWGKLISIDGSLKDTVGVKNPYRYRGFRYDTETGLYYLNSRYYNLEWGRFINADSIVGQTGNSLSYKLFAYCENNSTSKFDSNGYMTCNLMYGDVNVVYRAVTRADVATMAAGLGICAKAPQGSWSYVQHAYEGSKGYAKYNNPWISTAKSPSVAKYFCEKGSGEGIIKIDLTEITSEMHDLVEELGDFKYAWQEEISVKEFIPMKAIVGYSSNLKPDLQQALPEAEIFKINDECPMGNPFGGGGGGGITKSQLR